MITAVDTSVLLDVFVADQHYGPPSRDALRQALSEGAVVACDIVWAETAAAFPDEAAAALALDELGVEFSPMARSDALSAGRSWRKYRQGGGRRDRVIADFLIAAHAGAHADRFLTRDRGFYRRHFPELTILDPSRGQ